MRTALSLLLGPISYCLPFLQAAILLTTAELVSAAILSAETNGVYLAVGAYRTDSDTRTNSAIRFDERLAFMAFCNTGAVELQYSSEPARFARISMVDPSGRPVAKTSLGRRFDIDPPQKLAVPETVQLTNGVFIGSHTHQRTRYGILLAWGSYSQDAGLGGSRPLPSARDLFVMRESGVYSLSLEAEMFLVSTGANRLSRRPFTFPPMTIKVEKPPERLDR